MQNGNNPRRTVDMPWVKTKVSLQIQIYAVIFCRFVAMNYILSSIEFVQFLSYMLEKCWKRNSEGQCPLRYMFQPERDRWNLTGWFS